MNKIIPLFLLLLCSIQSCTPDSDNAYPKPDNLISEDTYIDLLIDMQLAKVVFNSEEFSDADSILTIIYDKYGITEEQYRTSHAWYQSNYEEQQERVDIAKERLLREQARLESAPDSTQSSDN
ncbi:DUF4296 domain-containing protein [Balneola sp. MJW-20]|uniref:DUF4296 domain-containing protein n=1 Tax=Gracilimonas aurantiaca TaxID=3234185 RepID=UPI0034650B20